MNKLFDFTNKTTDKATIYHNQKTYYPFLLFDRSKTITEYRKNLLKEAECYARKKIKEEIPDFLVTTKDGSVTTLDFMGVLYKINHDTHEVTRSLPFFLSEDSNFNLRIKESGACFFYVRRRILRLICEYIENKVDARDENGNIVPLDFESSNPRSPFFNQDHIYKNVLSKVITRVLNTAWGKRSDFMRATLGKVLWKELGEDVVKLTIKIVSFEHLRAGNYTFVAKHYDALKMLCETTPAVAIFFKMFSDTEQHLCRCMIHGENCVGNCKADSVEIVKAVKSSLREVTNSGWRYVCSLPANWAFLFNFYRDIRGGYDGYRFPNIIGFETPSYENLSQLINFLSLIHDKPKYTTLKRTLTNLDSGIINLRGSEYVIRAAFRESHKKKSDFFSREMQLVLDWFRNSNEDLEHSQLTAPWSFFMRKQVEWHIRRPEPGINYVVQDVNQKWNCILPDTFEITESGETFEVVSLTNGQQLVDEGIALDHCVATYIDICVYGRSKIFSIRQDEKPLATMELVPSNNKWIVNQVRGYDNKFNLISQEQEKNVKKVADTVSRMYNKKILEIGSGSDSIEKLKLAMMSNEQVVIPPGVYERYIDINDLFAELI